MANVNSNLSLLNCLYLYSGHDKKCDVATNKTVLNSI